MKVLLVHNFYRTQMVGGEDRVFQSELAELKRVLGKENVFSYSVSNDDLNLASLFSNIFFSLRHFFKIQNLIKKHQISVVHVHNFFPLLSPSVFLAAKLSGAKTVHTLHNYRPWCIAGTLYLKGQGVCERCTKQSFPVAGVLSGCYRGSKTQSLVAQIAFLIYRALRYWRWMDSIWVLSQFQKEKIQTFGIQEQKIQILPNSIAESAPASEGSRSGYLYVGRLEEEKGIDLLLSAWINIQTHEVLTVIGEGPLNSELKKRYEHPRIQFLGKKNSEEVLIAMQSAKFLVNPSRVYETFGLTILEAFSVGTPVIAFDVGTRSMLVKHEENGYLAHEKNLQETIERALLMQDYAGLSLHAKMTASRYEHSLVTEKKIRAYRSVLETASEGVSG